MDKCSKLSGVYTSALLEYFLQRSFIIIVLLCEKQVIGEKLDIVQGSQLGAL